MVMAVIAVKYTKSRDVIIATIVLDEDRFSNCLRQVIDEDIA